MNKALLAVLVSALVFPSFAQAAWYDPFVWIVSGRFDAPAARSAAVSETDVDVVAEATSTEPVFVEPSTEELLKRIAELETKLDKALAKNAELEKTTKTVAAAASTASAAKSEPETSGLTSAELIAKVRPAIVAVDTATSSGSGVVVDAQGRILVSAQVVLTYDLSGAAIGAAETMNVTFSNGSTKPAKLIGLNEAHDIAMIQLTSKSASSYIKTADVSVLKQGDKAYVFASPASRVGNDGTDVVSGTVTQKTSSAIEINSDKRPLDLAGALVNGNGSLLAIPRSSTCRVMEEMQKCLTYKTSSEIVTAYVPKVSEGMRLFKNKKVRTDEEFLVRGQLEGTKGAINASGSLQYAISSLSGKNSFDNFNGKLVDDQEGKITKLYLNKLKVGADSMVKAFDTLKAQSHTLNIFFIDYAAQVLTLGDYQKKLLKGMELQNAAKYKEYEAKVSYWSAKKNEYDALITNPANATHDYLMEEGADMEAGVKYLVSEQKRVLDSVASEVIALF